MPRTLILAALPTELSAAQRRLDRLDHASISPLATGDACGLASVLFATTGIGPQRVAQTLPTLLDAHRPDRVIHLGFAGGLDPNLKPGDTFPIREVRTLAAESSLQLSMPSQLPPGMAPRTLVTVAKAAYTPAAKQRLREQSGADAVDMETHTVATICRQRGIRLIAFRAITDAAGETLPPGILALTAADGRPRVWAAIRYLLRHPQRLPALIRLARRSSRCAAALAHAILPTLHSDP
jgi:adenosylhomocysteine nucleosidase